VLLRLAIETTRYSSGGGIENNTTKRSATKGNSSKMATVSRHRAPKEKDEMKKLVRKTNTALERRTFASSDIVSHSANCHYDYAIRAATRKNCVALKRVLRKLRSVAQLHCKTTVS
jgi:hypothetical protein